MIENRGISEKKFLIETLSKTIILKCIDKILELDAAISNEMGNLYGNDPWGRSNFLSDFRKKWEFSQVVFSQPKGKVLGFVIASEVLVDEIHIHRFAVSSDSRGMGIGKELINKISGCVDTYKYKRVTVEVSCLNQKAIAFYKNNGFNFLTIDELADYVAKRKQGVEIIENFIRESDGSDSYILQNII